MAARGVRLRRALLSVPCAAQAWARAHTHTPGQAPCCTPAPPLHGGAGDTPMRARHMHHKSYHALPHPQAAAAGPLGPSSLHHHACSPGLPAKLLGQRVDCQSKSAQSTLRTRVGAAAAVSRQHACPRDRQVTWRAQARAARGMQARHEPTLKPPRRRGSSPRRRPCAARERACWAIGIEGSGLEVALRGPPVDLTAQVHPSTLTQKTLPRATSCSRSICLIHGSLHKLGGVVSYAPRARPMHGVA
jgi:hypothetical protein